MFAPPPQSNLQYANFPFDQFREQNLYGQGSLQLNTANTPSVHSQASGSLAAENSAASTMESDPLLSLLEQLAENEQLDLLGGELGNFDETGGEDIGQGLMQ